MIVTVGFLLGDATAGGGRRRTPTRASRSSTSPTIPPLPNVEGLVYATAEGAMLAGYASASWSKTGIVGTFGGINIGPGVTDFMDGFIAGVNYWNEEQGADVRVLGGRVPSDPDSGTFTGNFDSTDDAKNVTQGMLDEGADVILPVGGPIGGGTFAAIDESGAEAGRARCRRRLDRERTGQHAVAADEHHQAHRQLGLPGRRARAERRAARRPRSSAPRERGCWDRAVPRLRGPDLAGGQGRDRGRCSEVIIAGDVVPVGLLRRLGGSRHRN